MPDAGEAERVGSTRWLILLGLITAAIMEVLDTTIVNVALPQMAGNLGATQQEIGWVATGYILSNVVVLPMTAFFTERFGRRRYLTASIILFAVASFLCGTSHSLVELVMWRVLQGAGGAALLSTAQATIRQIFPREQQGMVQAVFLLGIIVAPTLGPTLGGWITDNYTWNWCFFINIPIAIAATFLVTTFLHDPPGARRRAGAVDWLGITPAHRGARLAAVRARGGQPGRLVQRRGTIVRLAILAGVCLVTMVWWELTPRNRHPIVNFRVLKNRELAASIFLFVALGFGLYGGVFIFPLFTQRSCCTSPRPRPGWRCCRAGWPRRRPRSSAAGSSTGRGRWWIRASSSPSACAIFVVAMWDLGHLTTDAGEPDVRLALIIRGAGLGFLFTPINNVAYASLKPSEAQQAAGLINLARQLGGSFGIAILATYVTVHTQIHRVDLLANVYPGQRLVDERLQALTANLIPHGYGPDAAHRGALALLDQQVMRQASMLSYNDAWMLLLLTFLVVSPAILLLRKPRGGGPGGGGRALSEPRRLANGVPT